MSEIYGKSNSMIHVRKNIRDVFAICLSGVLGGLIASPPVMAATLEEVRTGEHNGYSRLVFEWDDLGGYVVDSQSAGRSVIRFTGPADIPATINAEAFNLEGIRILETDPLTIEIDHVDATETRYFTAGDRVVFDIYDAPGRPRPDSLIPEDERDDRPPSGGARTAPAEGQAGDTGQNQSSQELRQNEAGLFEVTDVAPQDLPSAQDLEPVEDASANTPNRQEEEESQDQAADKPSSENLINLSATEGFSLAVFETPGALNLLADKPNLLMKPQVSGPDADFFLPVQRMNVQGAQAFRTRMMDFTDVNVGGQGLIWSVFVTPEAENKPAPVKLERRDAAAGSIRSGALFIPVENLGREYDLTDPATGFSLKVFPARKAQDKAVARQDFVDFTILESHSGVAIRPKLDGLEFDVSAKGLLITHPQGLSISSPEQIEAAESIRAKTEQLEKRKEKKAGQILFNFEQWHMGGVKALNQNRTLMLGRMNGQDKSVQAENLISLARMHLASGRGAEALGFLDLAGQTVPVLEKNPEFLALRGVARAFDWKNEYAFEDLLNPALDQFDEIKLWRGYALADLGDWQQAAEVTHNDFSYLYDYTPEVRNRLAITLAEIKLRAGEIEQAEELFEIIAIDKDQLNMALGAELQYLKGEAARQRGDIDDTIELWEPLTEGADDLHRVKSGLALTRLLLEERDLPYADAIDNLERLRYAWRGDTLEAQVNYWLGKIYFESGDYIKGLTILRNVIPLAGETELAREAAEEMTRLFTEFYLGPTLQNVSPIQAMALYEQFKELVPTGEQGDMVIRALAERLVKADMLERASGLLQGQVDHRLEGIEAVSTAIRLAAIRLLDQKPKESLMALNQAEEKLEGQTDIPEKTVREKGLEISLLRARAISRDGEPAQALSLLEELPQTADVNRLQADIAWEFGFWDEAAFALRDVIADETINLNRPLTEQQAALILNRAVALNLAGDRIGLANLRENYSDAMAQTVKSQMFELVTRPRQNVGFSSRETILSAAEEVDLFRDFLNSYRDMPDPATN